MAILTYSTLSCVTLTCYILIYELWLHCTHKKSCIKTTRDRAFFDLSLTTRNRRQSHVKIFCGWIDILKYTRSRVFSANPRPFLQCFHKCYAKKVLNVWAVLLQGTTSLGTPIRCDDAAEQLKCSKTVRPTLMKHGCLESLPNCRNTQNKFVACLIFNKLLIVLYFCSWRFLWNQTCIIISIDYSDRNE